MIRLFAALNVPPEVGRGLQARQTGIEAARWRPLEALHITLRFLGEIREDVARDLDGELMSLEQPPFEVILEGSGAFAEGDGPSAVWAGVAENPELRRLAKACEMAARRVGLPPDPRRYRPHVTLAYLRRSDPGQVAAWIETHARLRSPPILVDHFSLYSSTLSPEGSRYRIEATYPLPQASTA